MVEAAAPNGKWNDADVAEWKDAFLDRLELKVGALPAAPPGCPLTDARSEVTSLLELHAHSWTGWPGWPAAVPLVAKLSGDPDWVGALLAEFCVAEEIPPL